MAYVDLDYPTAKAFREAVSRGIQHRPYNPSGLFPSIQNGTEFIEGPHFPKPHRWYAAVEVKDGVVVRVKR